MIHIASPRAAYALLYAGGSTEPLAKDGGGGDKTAWQHAGTLAAAAARAGGGGGRGGSRRSAGGAAGGAAASARGAERGFAAVARGEPMPHKDFAGERGATKKEVGWNLATAHEVRGYLPDSFSSKAVSAKVSTLVDKHGYSPARAERVLDQAMRKSQAGEINEKADSHLAAHLRGDFANSHDPSMEHSSVRELHAADQTYKGLSDHVLKETKAGRPVDADTINAWRHASDNYHDLKRNAPPTPDVQAAHKAAQAADENTGRAIRFAANKRAAVHDQEAAKHDAVAKRADDKVAHHAAEIKKLEPRGPAAAAAIGKHTTARINAEGEAKLARAKAAAARAKSAPFHAVSETKLAHEDRPILGLPAPRGGGVEDAKAQAQRGAQALAAWKERSSAQRVLAERLSAASNAARAEAAIDPKKDVDAERVIAHSAVLRQAGREAEAKRMLSEFMAGQQARGQAEAARAAESARTEGVLTTANSAARDRLLADTLSDHVPYGEKLRDRDLAVAERRPDVLQQHEDKEKIHGRFARDENNPQADRDAALLASASHGQKATEIRDQRAQIEREARSKANEYATRVNPVSAAPARSVISLAAPAQSRFQAKNNAAKDREARAGNDSVERAHALLDRHEAHLEEGTQAGRDGQFLRQARAEADEHEAAGGSIPKDLEARLNQHEADHLVRHNAALEAVHNMRLSGPDAEKMFAAIGKHDLAKLNAADDAEWDKVAKTLQELGGLRKLG